MTTLQHQLADLHRRILEAEQAGDYLRAVGLLGKKIELQRAHTEVYFEVAQ